MKFLLTAINAKYIHSNPAIYSLRAHAGEELQEHVELAEYTINQSFAEILADIYRRRPDVLGISCYIWNITMVLELVRELPKLLPGMPIWLGGPEVSFDAPQLLERYPEVTGVMIGEGEETFRELLQFYVEAEAGSWITERRKGTDCGQGQISGLCLREGFTAPRQPADMSHMPFLYHDLEGFENKIIYYESSRGCPFRCSYCLSSIDKSVRLRDVGIVRQELQFFLDHQVKQVKFVDRTFNCSHEHAAEIWRYLLEHDNGITNFHFEVSADILNEEEIGLLNRMRPGQVQLEIGVQSTNPDTIRAINRSMNVERLEQKVAAIRTGGNVHLHLDLIAGLPREDYAGFAASFNRVYAMKPEQLQLGFLKVLKGSELHRRAEEYGIVCLDKPPYEVLCTNWLSYEEVLRLKGVEEMVELYYNSNQFRAVLAFLEKQFDTPFEMFERLAQFYREKGYFTNSPSRAYRYQVLLEFAAQESMVWIRRKQTAEQIYDVQDGERYGTGELVEICSQLLTYDMYLRENLKTRPEFAADGSIHKELLRGFYLREEQERRFLPDYQGYDHKQLAKMTHAEYFTYPGECFVLFDYRHRDPLTGDARTVVFDRTMTEVLHDNILHQY